MRGWQVKWRVWLVFVVVMAACLVHRCNQRFAVRRRRRAPQVLFILSQAQVGLLHGDNAAVSTAMDAARPLLDALAASNDTAAAAGTAAAAFLAQLRLQFNILRTLHLMRCGEYETLTKAGADSSVEAVTVLQQLLAQTNGVLSFDFFLLFNVQLRPRVVAIGSSHGVLCCFGVGAQAGTWSTARLHPGSRQRSASQASFVIYSDSLADDPASARSYRSRGTPLHLAPRRRSNRGGAPAVRLHPAAGRQVEGGAAAHLRGKAGRAAVPCRAGHRGGRWRGRPV